MSLLLLLSVWKSNGRGRRKKTLFFSSISVNCQKQPYKERNMEGEFLAFIYVFFFDYVTPRSYKHINQSISI